MSEEQPVERYPFWTYFDLAVFVGLSIPCLFAGFGAVKLIFWALRLQPANKVVQLLPGQALSYFLMFLVLYAIFRLYERPFWESLGWRPVNFFPPAIVFAGVGTAVVVAVIGALMHTPNAETPMTDLLKGPLSIVLMAIFGVTFGPLCEELIFRGFLQPLLVRSLGAAPGILVASLPFGLLHFQEYGNSWRHVVLISLTGAAFGWMRHFTGSTKASTLMHGAYNGLVFTMFLLVKGVR